MNRARVTIIIDAEDGGQEIYSRLCGDVELTINDGYDRYVAIENGEAIEIPYLNPFELANREKSLTLTIKNLELDKKYSTNLCKIDNPPFVNPPTDEQILEDAKRVVKETKARLKKSTNITN